MRTAAVLAVVVVVTLARGSVADDTIDDAVREVAKATFAHLDKDGDGFWSQAELTREMNALDVNGDGRVPWEEFKKDMEKNRKEAFANFATSSIMEEVQKAVVQCIGKNHGFAIPVDLQWTDNQPWQDTDGDGALSEDEFVNFKLKVMLLNINGSNQCP